MVDIKDKDGHNKMADIRTKDWACDRSLQLQHYTGPDNSQNTA